MKAGPERGAVAGVDRLVAVLLPLAALGIVLACWGTFRLLPTWSWSASRLASPIRLAYGMPLYTPSGGVAMNDWIYGPVGAIAYTPAALAGDPASALWIATALNGLYFLLPAVVLFGGRALRSNQARLAGLGFLFAVGALLAPFGTWYNAAVLHVDCVAICLSVLSCLVLGRSGRLPWAAAWCVLAISTKQIVVPLALVQLGFLLKTRGRLPAVRYAGWLALAGAIAALGFCGWFGVETLWRDMVYIPSHHPVEWARTGGVVAAFCWGTWWVWPVAAVAAWLERRLPADDERRLAWFLLIAAVCLLPGGVISALKYGGGQNSLHSLSFAILGGALLLVCLARAVPAGGGLVARAALIAGLTGALGFDLKRVFEFGHLTRPDPAGARREAFEFVRARPGQTYFPCDTLATLMAERRDYPFEYGYVDWNLAGVAPGREEIRRSFPATLRFIVYHEKDVSGREMRRFFPEFTHMRVSGPWVLYTRPPPVAPGSN